VLNPSRSGSASARQSLPGRGPSLGDGGVLLSLVDPAIFAPEAARAHRVAEEVERRVAGWWIADCMLESLRYRKGFGLDTAYRLRAVRRGGETREVLAYRKAAPPERIESLGEEWESSATALTPLGSRGWFDEGYGVALWFLPGEPCLRGLPLALNPGHAARGLERLWDLEEGELQRALRHLRLRPRTYEPEDYCAVLGEWRSLSGQGNGGGGAEIVVFADPRRARAAYEAAEACRRARPPDGLHVPGVALVDGQPATLYMESPGGDPLLEAGAGLGAGLRAVGRALAWIHTSPPEGWPDRRAGALAASARPGPGADLADLFEAGEGAGRMRDLEYRLREASARVGDGRPAPCLGGVAPEAFVVRGEGVFLTRWSGAGWGDPHQDLGLFEARLLLEEARGRLDPQLGREARQFTRRIWRQGVGDLFSPRRHLLRRAQALHHEMRRLLVDTSPDWRSRLEWLLDVVDADLESLRLLSRGDARAR